MSKESSVNHREVPIQPLLQGVKCVAPTRPDDSDALSHARPHSLCRPGAGGLLRNRHLQRWLLWHTGVFRGCRRRSEHRALGAWGRPSSVLGGPAGRHESKPKSGRYPQRETRAPFSSDPSPIQVLIQDVTIHQPPCPGRFIPFVTSNTTHVSLVRAETG